MTAEIQALQERAYSAGYDYRANAPHLRHARLYDWFTSALRAEIAHVSQSGLPTTVLEIGAGDGAFVEPLLAAGAKVTATEMSRDSLAALQSRFRTNPAFEAVFDPEGSLDDLDGRRYAIVLYASVLHHIPDYLAALSNACDHHLMPGGTLMTIQDPMWYPSLRRGVRSTSEVMYLTWRLTRGDLLRGIRSRSRRMRHELRTDEPSDMVEYHAVRNGVSQDDIARLLSARFEHVAVTQYWSAHAPIWQRTGQRLGLRNTFAVRARHRQASTGASAA